MPSFTHYIVPLRSFFHEVVNFTSESTFLLDAIINKLMITRLPKTEMENENIIFNQDLNNNIHEYKIEMYALLSMICLERGNSIPLNFTSMIMKAIIPEMESLNLGALNLLVSCSRCIPSNEFGNYLGIIVDSLMCYIESSNLMFSVNTKSNTDLIYFKFEEVEPIFEFTDCTFKNGFKYFNQNTFIESDSLSSYCENELICKLGLVSQSLENHIQLLNNFVDIYCCKIKELKFISSQVYSHILVLFLICNNITSTFSVEIPCISNLLIDDLIFNPKVIYQSNDLQMKSLTSLRNCALLLGFCSGKESFSKILLFLASYPKLFEECMIRILWFHDNQIKRKSSSFSIENVLAKILNFYRILEVNGNESVSESRSYIIQYFVRNKNYDYFYQKDNYFSNTLLGIIFEKNIKDMIFIQIDDIMCQQGILTIAFDHLAILIDSINDMSPTYDTTDLLCSLLNAYNKAIARSHLQLPVFKKVAYSLIQNLESIRTSSLFNGDNLNIAEEFLMILMRFFAITSSSVSFDIEIFKILSKFIKVIFPNFQYPTELYQRFLQICASDSSLSTTPAFKIRQVHALMYLVKLFLHTDMKVEIVEFCGKLCDYSQYNSFQCHKAQLDLVLLDKLLDVWYGEVDPKFVQATLYLLGKIASVISSPIVVQKFVSLLCPIENKRLSIFFMNVMNTLNSIVSSTLKKPESFIPIKSSNVIRYSSQSLIDTGLTFYTWIYIEEVIPKYKSILMRIDFDVNKFLCLYIDGDKLIINLQDFDELIALDAGKIPFRSWCFVSFTLDFNDNCGNPIDLLKLSTYINYNIGKIFQIPMHDFLKESLSISFNGTFHDPCEIAANPVYPLTPIVHGPIYLFAHPLTETQILTTYTQGPLRSKISIYSKIIPEFGYIPPFTSETYNTTLSSILVYQFKLNILIPLFSLYDFQTDNFQVIVDASIELISNSLLVSEEAEIDFANAHGFDVIYHLLLQYSPKFINYAMYKKFFTLLQMLRTDKLQQQLIEAILANNELWIIADNDSQLSILKHWSKTLFSTVVSSIPFSDLLNMFIMYYWNKPAKKYLLKGLPGSPRPRADKLNIFECQKIFGDVLLQVSKYNFSDDDLTFLIGHIMNCNDEHQVFILMNLIKKIIINTETNESLRNTLIKFDFISFTRRMIKHKSDQAVFKTLEITILLHQKKLITSLRLQTNMNLFYFESPKMYLKSKIFDKLIKNQYHKIPEIFNMLIFMATNLSDEKFFIY